MKKNNSIGDIEPEYDFTTRVRGKYAARLAEENGYIKIDPKVVKYFKNSDDINNVLLAIIDSMHLKGRGSANKI